MERPLVGNRYELGPAIGSGGFGTVFRARDRSSGADVAVKLVLPGLGSQVAAERLRREGEIVRRVSSRHVARVYDSGEDEQGTWLVSELVDGAPLTAATLGRPLLPHEVLRVARGLLEGLAAVHNTGIVHGDVKPSNVLVARGDKALDSAKLVDFGLARIVARSEIGTWVGDPTMIAGAVVGTARWMAPELLSGSEPTPRSDLYAVGLLLFELLEVGPLFPVGSGAPQLRARLMNDPDLAERVPEPLASVLAHMLARDPADRWPDAETAHLAVVDLDTAPVSAVGADEPTMQSAHLSSPPSMAVVPEPAASKRAPTISPDSVASLSSTSERPVNSGISVQVPVESRRRSLTPGTISRLTTLPADPAIALRETLRHVDLPMLDALARRERGNALGRVARAMALSLRLELDAAALILEPLASQSDVARAIGAAVLGPRARRITRARVDADREDRWIESLDAELAAMLVALSTSLSTADDAERDTNRCVRALARLDAAAARDGAAAIVEATRTTLRIAQMATRVRRGELDRGAALDLVAPLVAGANVYGAEATFHVVVRALCIATLLGDSLANDGIAELERAARIAAETGATHLDASACTALGALLVSRSPRDERGLAALERAVTLLANSDAPTLEHEAEHHRATALIALGRWEEAVGPLRAARQTAHAEHAGDLEIHSASLAVLAELALGNMPAAFDAAAVLADARLAKAKGTAAALAWVARALTALTAQDRDGAEDALAEAEARVREANRTTADVYVLVEVVGILLDAARGALPDLAGPAAGLERFAEEHGFEGFHWLDVLGAVIERLPDEEAAAKMTGALDRLEPVLGPKSRLARERRTDAPPSAAI